jgi:hypothetical protein
VRDRLTDEELNGLDTSASWLVNKDERIHLPADSERRVGLRVQQVVAELRERRARDLTDEDAEALGFLRRLFQPAMETDVFPGSASIKDRIRSGFAALERLLAAKGS